MSLRSLPILSAEEQERLSSQVLGLARRLLQQAQAEEWELLKETDARLARFAGQMADKYPQTWAGMTATRAEVRALYQRAITLCQHECEQRLEAWQALNGQRVGLAAYDEVQQWQ
ncbi:LafX [Aeromonas australiensis]|uniref:LafX n=1 Tax=Aeromonas australiensis TaxID=1114880 RepID=UPI001F4180A1|nr:LafX [Aeromonas australiensis]MCF3095885.1 LafX [Aeromonas australiensis]